jgi:hypothetical protein
MTPDQIRNYECPNDVSVQFWIKEVALQLAIQNERAERAECQADADRQSFGPACAMYAKFLLEGSG